MELSTKRLDLVALSAHQLHLWTHDTAQLEKELQCTYLSDPLEGPLRQAVEELQVKVKKAGDDYPLSTFWFLIRQQDKVVIGSICLKGLSANGEVEIGYGMGEEYRGQGYMSEALRAVCRWALRQPGVHRILAQTDMDNPESQRVLRRCGFSLVTGGEENMWWRMP